MSENDGPDKTMVSREAYDRMEKIHLNNLWNYVQAYARACDYIGKNFGDEAVRQFHVQRGRERAIPALKQAAEKGVDKFMSMMHQHMNNIGGAFTLEETDDEIIVRGKCSTGGRYIREEGTERSKEGVPYYCVHCPIWWEEIPRELGVKIYFDMDDQGNDCAWRAKK